MATSVDRGKVETLETLSSPVASYSTYASPWFIVSSKPGECVLSQYGSNLDAQPYTQLILTEVKDAYKNTSVASAETPHAVSAAKAVLTQKEVWQIRSDATGDPCCCTTGLKYPISGTVTLTVPRALPFNVEGVLSALDAFIDELLGTAKHRIVEQLYGDVNPTDSI